MFSQEESEKAYAELVKNESVTLTILGALAGCIPAFAIYAFFTTLGGVLAIFLFIPSMVIGLFARFVGRPFNVKPRIFAGILAVVLHCAAIYLFGFHPLTLILAPACFIAAVTISKVSLDRLQNYAITQAEVSSIGTNNPL